MKKMIFSAAIVAAACLTSCGGQAPKANLNSEVDSLSYMMGVSNARGFDMFLTQQLDADSTYMADFIKGVKEGINKNSKKEIVYTAGVQIGQQFSSIMYERLNDNLFAGDSTQTLSKDNLLAGFIAALEKKASVTPEAAASYVNEHAEAIKTKAIEKKWGPNKEAGEKFLAENATKEGVKTTESGLQYKVIKEGKGAVPTKDSKVKVNYKGTLIDGTQFDSSYDRNEPTTFRANQVIKGWTEALTMMPVGSKWELYIPQELAYGPADKGTIKPFSALIFEVELIEIVK